MSERDDGRRSPRSKETTPSVFGMLLHQIREREHLTARKVARDTGVHETMIGRMESGERKPPLEASFYEGLNNIPGITPGERAQFLRATLYDRFGFDDEAINSMLSIPPTEEIRLRKLGLKSVSDGEVTIFYRVVSSPEALDDKETDAYERIIAMNAKDLLRNLNRQKAARQKKMMSYMNM